MGQKKKKKEFEELKLDNLKECKNIAVKKQFQGKKKKKEKKQISVTGFFPPHFLFSFELSEELIILLS